MISIREVQLVATTFLLLIASSVPARAATPVSSCGQIATTSVQLTKSLKCNGPGIIVGAPGITIDLDGHTLDGNRGSDHGIDNGAHHSDVVVMNGVIQNFNIGIFADCQSNGIEVEDVKSVDNLGDGIFVCGDSPFIASSRFDSNGNYGIEIHGNSAVVSNVFAMRNFANGIDIGGTAALVEFSTASNNTSSGIFVSGDSARVLSSKASRNGQSFPYPGIEVRGNGVTVDRNRATQNGGLGINVFAYTIAPVGHNRARRNGNPAECAPSALC